MKTIILAFIIAFISTLGHAMDSRVNESKELAFGRLGMDQFSLHEGVKCNSELNKSITQALGNTTGKFYARGVKN